MAATVTCETGALAQALRDVRAAVKRTTAVPIMAHVLIEGAPGERMRMTGCDLGIRAVRHVDARSAAPFAFTVDAHRFGDVVNAFDAGSQTAIEVDGGRVIAKSSRSRFTFSSLPAQQFPPMAARAQIASFVLSGKALQRAFDGVRFAASADVKTLPYLAGIYVHVADGLLRFVASDGNRLARWSMPVPEGAESMPGTIISTECVDLARKAAGDGKGDVRVTIGDAWVSFDFGDLIVTGNTIDATYPAYDRIIPSAAIARVSLDRDALLSAVQRISLIKEDRYRKVRLAIDADRIVINGANANGEDGTEEVPCDLVGEPVTLSYQGAYLKDALTVIDTDTVDLAISSAFGTATVLTSATLPEATLVLMPLRI